MQNWGQCWIVQDNRGRLDVLSPQPSISSLRFPPNKRDANHLIFSLRGPILPHSQFMWTSSRMGGGVPGQLQSHIFLATMGIWTRLSQREEPKVSFWRITGGEVSFRRGGHMNGCKAGAARLTLPWHGENLPENEDNSVESRVNKWREMVTRWTCFSCAGYPHLIGSPWCGTGATDPSFGPRC